MIPAQVSCNPRRNMPYLIDGYNLAHAMNLLPGTLGPHGLESARRNLLDFLANHADGQSMTVVFDAQDAPRGARTHDHHKGVHILFAPVADDLIEDLIADERNPRQLVVVSGDNRLRSAARRRGCPVLDCLDFVEKLTHPPPPPSRKPSESEDKPEVMSQTEVEDWLKEFEQLDEGTPPGWY